MFNFTVSDFAQDENNPEIHDAPRNDVRGRAQKFHTDDVLPPRSG